MIIEKWKTGQWSGQINEWKLLTYWPNEKPEKDNENDIQLMMDWMKIVENEENILVIR